MHFIDALLNAPHTESPEELWEITKDDSVICYGIQKCMQPLYNFIFQQELISALIQRFNYTSCCHNRHNSEETYQGIYLPATSFAQLFPTPSKPYKTSLTFVISVMEDFKSWNPKPEPLLEVLEDYHQ